MESQVPPTPDWFNKKFLETVIKQYKNDNSITIIGFSINGTFNDHFASAMYRTSIEFMSKQSMQNETKKVVIKAQPSKESTIKDVTSDAPLFKTEISMYRNILPTFKQLFESKGDTINICPELIYISEYPFPVIILQDLSFDGYNVLSEPLTDLQDSKLVFQKLAKFHAASYYFAEHNNVDFTNYNYSIYHSEMILKTCIEEAICVFREVMEEWVGCEKYYSKIDWLLENVADVGKKCYIPNKPGHGYNVLNHGDFHLKNILMKKNSDTHIEDFCFIDFQTCVWCSPVVDLSYAFAMVRRPDQGTSNNDELLMYYHQEFVGALKQCGFKKSPPSLLDLNVELLQHGAINTIIWICFLPFSFADWANLNVMDIMGNDHERTRSFKKTLYNNPICKSLLLNEMNSWIAKGWL
ncbi:unnamed protein product [Diamesa serratosioi]